MSNPFNPAFASPSTAGSSLLVPGVPGMRIKVLALHAMSTLAQTIQLLSNTTPCSAVFPVSAQGGWVWPAGILPVNMAKGTFLFAPWAQTNIGEDLNVTISANSNTGIQLIWVAA